MALVKIKPTSAGRRSMVKVVNADLHKGAPYAPLVEAQSQARRAATHMGNITTRHQGGGHKQHYRIIDFRRDKDGIPAKVERLEYDPNRSANIALLLLRRRRAPLHHRAQGPDGRRRSSRAAPRRRSSRATRCRCATSRSARRCTASRCCPARARRSRAPRAPACSCSRAKANTRSCACARARSAACTSTAAPPSARSATRSTTCASIGKAGANRWRGIRPTVRGETMNPVDHPHGGGEARAATATRCRPWGQPAKGKKTRNNKRTAA